MSLGPPGGDMAFGGTTMNRGLCLWFGWERPFHDEVTETGVVVHTKLLWS
jgi:hypothetical protein